MIFSPFAQWVSLPKKEASFKLLRCSCTLFDILNTFNTATTSTLLNFHSVHFDCEVFLYVEQYEENTYACLRSPSFFAFVFFYQAVIHRSRGAGLLIFMAACLISRNNILF